MEKIKIYSMWTSAQADMLGLHIHLYTNGFAGSREKAPESLGVEMASLVLLLGHHLQGAEGLPRAGDHRAACRRSLCKYCWLVEMVYKTLGLSGVQSLLLWQNILNGQPLQNQR